MIRVKNIKGEEYTIGITKDDPLWQDYYNKWLDYNEKNGNIKDVEDARNKLADKVIEIIYAEQEKRILKELADRIAKCFVFLDDNSKIDAKILDDGNIQLEI